MYTIQNNVKTVKCCAGYFTAIADKQSSTDSLAKELHCMCNNSIALKYCNDHGIKRSASNYS